MHPSGPFWRGRSRRVTSAAAAVFLLSAAPSTARGRFSVEAFLGAARSLGTALSIHQAGEPDIQLSSTYETRSFDLPLYYSLRFGLRREGGAWEAQFTHHKVYLVGATDVVERFEITHGFNLVTLNRSWTSLPITLRVGVGLVVAHPESVVRGASHDRGYHLTGPALLASAGKSFDLPSRWFVTLEGELTVARAKVPVAQGDASAPNVALHGLFGLGFRF